MNTIISFGICPFVQRSLITMNYKKVPYELKYIDLDDKPDWFLKLSPLGKVPVLLVDDEVLFESAVINEYIDEVNGDSLHCPDPLKKAQERAYIELSSVATMNYFQALTAKDEESYLVKKEMLEKNLTSLLAKYNGPFFRGGEFSLVDTSVIPLIMRLFMTGDFASVLELSSEDTKKLQDWAAATLSMPEVVNSVPETFESDHLDYLRDKESYFLSQ